MITKSVDKDVLLSAVNELCRKDAAFARSLWQGIKKWQATTNPSGSRERVFIHEQAPISSATNKRSLDSNDNDYARDTKRPRGKAAVCTNCGAPFTTGSDATCQHHTGKLEADYDDDCWADQDEDCHGRIDSTFCKVEYPENYTWTCCNRTGDYKGCRLGSRHVAHGSRSNHAYLVRGGLKLTRKNAVKEISTGNGSSTGSESEESDEETAGETDEDDWDD